jgi:hypothetical protein
MKAFTAASICLVAERGAVFQLQLEAARGAQALHRRRREHHDEGVLDAAEGPFNWPATAPPLWSARLRSSKGLSVTNTMPELELLVKPLIDRPGNASVRLPRSGSS